VRKALFLLGCLLIAAWIAITILLFVGVVMDGCVLGSSSPDAPDCGDVRRGAFFISVALGVVTLVPGFLLILQWLMRRREIIPPEGAA